MGAPGDGRPSSTGRAAAAGADGGANVGNVGATETGTGYKALLAERDAKIVKLEGVIVAAAQYAETVEAQRAEMEGLRSRVRVACSDRDRQAFEYNESKQSGKTDLPMAGVAFDEGETMKRWREIASIVAVE